MKKHLFVSFLSLFILFTMLPAVHAQSFGSPLSQVDSIALADIFDFTEFYSEQIVVLKGKVTEQDPGGLWFYLSDEEYSIYVDLYESGFVIPDLIGKDIIIEGAIRFELGVPSMYATGLEVVAYINL